MESMDSMDGLWIPWLSAKYCEGSVGGGPVFCKDLRSTFHKVITLRSETTHLFYIMLMIFYFLGTSMNFQRRFS